MRMDKGSEVRATYKVTVIDEPIQRIHIDGKVSFHNQMPLMRDVEGRGAPCIPNGES